MQNGRPISFDTTKQAQVVAMLSLGCSRAAAARYVGVVPSTIHHWLEKDAVFRARVRQSERTAEEDLLSEIRKAATKSWRAAAWMLQRLDPDRYVRLIPSHDGSTYADDRWDVALVDPATEASAPPPAENEQSGVQAEPPSDAGPAANAPNCGDNSSAPSPNASEPPAFSPAAPAPAELEPNATDSGENSNGRPRPEPIAPYIARFLRDKIEEVVNRPPKQGRRIADADDEDDDENLDDEDGENRVGQRRPRLPFGLSKSEVVNLGGALMKQRIAELEKVMKR